MADVVRFHLVPVRSLDPLVLVATRLVAGRPLLGSNAILCCPPCNRSGKVPHHFQDPTASETYSSLGLGELLGSTIHRCHSRNHHLEAEGVKVRVEGNK